MSTNYYLYLPRPTGGHHRCDAPDCHVGLYSSGRFIWAQDAQRIHALASQDLDAVLFVDEYDRHLTGRDFLKVIENTRFDFSSMGVHFS